VVCITDILEDMLPPTLVFKYLTPKLEADNSSKKRAREFTSTQQHHPRIGSTSAFTLKISAQ
jgi:hypothetical protein